MNKEKVDLGDIKNLRWTVKNTASHKIVPCDCKIFRNTGACTGEVLEKIKNLKN